MKRGFVFIFAIGALLVLGRYFILPSQPSPASDNFIAGNYDVLYGTWHSEKTNAKGEIEIMIERSGELVTGELRVTGSSITEGGEITGVITGDKVEFGFVKDKRGMLKYTGTMSKDSISGNWEIPVMGDHGTWQAAKKS